MRFLRRSMMGLFLAAVAVGLLFYAAQIVGSAVQQRLADAPAAPQARERVFTVNTVIAEPATVNPVLETYGEVDARRRLELRAVVAGRIDFLAERFEDGGRVRAGEVLVRIDPADAEANVARLEADLADAGFEKRDAARGLELAQDAEQAAAAQTALRTRAFERQQDISTRGFGTPAAVEDAELAVASARANLLARRQALAEAEARIDQAQTRESRARIALEEARRDLEDTTITAPFDGVLSDTAAVEGGVVAANERLADLVDPTDLEVAFRISTAQYARLVDASGDVARARVIVRLEATGIDVSTEGVLARVDAGTGERQSGRVLYAHLEGGAGLQPGDFVTVAIVEPAISNVIRLPASALGADGLVLAVSEDNRIEALAAELVRRQGDDVLVRGEALAGREIIVSRTPLLGPGISVRPLRKERESSALADEEMLELSDERRARLVAFVEASSAMPENAKATVLAQLAERAVPAQVVEQLEKRMGG